MERSGQEMTRAMLLNSQSRGSLEEIAGDEDAVEMSGGAGYNAGIGGDESPEDAPFYAQWEGRDLTRQMYLQSYE